MESDGVSARLVEGSNTSLVVANPYAVHIEALSSIRVGEDGFIIGRILLGDMPITFHQGGVIEYFIDGVSVVDML